MWHRSLLFFWLLFSVLIFSSASLKAETNNWALIVDSSRYWFNYRHASNALSFYHILKERGIPDSQIILMLADDAACDSRNCMPSKIFNGMGGNLYDESIEVDYKGSEVNVLNLMRVITDRHEFGVPRSKRLMTNENSNLFVYFTGHGGDGFLKFQDQEELNSKDIADAFGQMYVQKRYNQILFLIDTCQASSMFEKLYSPNIVSIASSKVKESSYAVSFFSLRHFTGEFRLLYLHKSCFLLHVFSASK